jgi:hypothetical protein
MHQEELKSIISPYIAKSYDVVYYKIDRLKDDSPKDGIARIS